MPHRFKFISLLLLGLSCLPAPLSSQTDTLFQARMAMRDKPTYHFVEILQQRGRWVVPDFYYVDFGSNKFRELGAGGGIEPYSSKRMRVLLEGFFDQALGPNAHAARYVVPWSLYRYSFTSRLNADIVYFTLLPLNEAGRIQHVIERSRLEYTFKRVKFGPGYAGSKFGDRQWQHKPFLTFTVLGREMGDMEFWLQRVPGNHVQVQMRYRINIHTDGTR